MITIPKEVNNTEGLLIWLMGYFAGKFRNHAILKGGMVLRLLNCPRSTNDLEYLFIPYKSKKEIRPMLEKALQEIANSSYDLTMDSKCLRIFFSYENIKVQMEATVTEKCEVEALSNTNLGQRYKLNPLLINVQKRNIALAHKIAAWNERNLYRDLFDIYFFVSVLGVQPDINTLNQRLKQVQKGRVNKGAEMSLSELCDNLIKARENISAEAIAIELKPLLPENELSGLDLKIRVAIEQLLNFINK
ncbi:MAG: nucleotidyl transferase AbiEii/AbiGii toxin family protein [Planctomycetota bacterium]|jgi:predicted nucleotidyltransferase component of viral defense system